MAQGRSRQSGYVLVFTLLVLMIAAIALASSARRTVGRALEANRAVRELQNHWTSLTAHRVLLPQAEEVLSSEDTNTQSGRDHESGSPAERRMVAELNGRTVLLVFTDEQAKLNVNTHHGRLGLEETTQAVRRLSRNAATSHVRVDLRPVAMPARAGRSSESPAFFGSYGQVWEDSEPEDLLGAPAKDESPVHRRTGLSSRITCWGDGRVRLQRASRDTLIEVLRGGPAVGLADALIRLREESPDLTVAEAARRLQLDRNRSLALAERLTDGSACHGLWIVLSDEARVSYSLAIEDSRSGARATNHRWVWP